MLSCRLQPIPLDLLTLVNFTDAPTQRGTGLLRNIRGGERRTDGSSVMTPGSTVSPETATDSRSVYPCTLHHNGRLGGPYILYAESAASRSEWKQKLEEALGIRKVVQESNKVFEIETLSADTFLVPSLLQGATSPPAWNQENSFTGKVTCSVPFSKWKVPCFMSRRFNGQCSQILQTGVGLSQSDVLKESGLDSVMTQSVGFVLCCASLSQLTRCHSSDATGASSQAGHTMRYAGGVWCFLGFG